VDAIIGHHAHVVHGVELIGRTPVLYSLGNFAFHRLQTGVGVERPSPAYNLGPLRGDESHDSLAVLLRFGPRGFVEMEAHPVRLDRNWEPAAPEPAAAERILSKFAAMSRDLDTAVDVAQGAARLAAR
jgi:poly-gamma-glutamate capsule biosynthesis protein CapA/YwtB (metallophosphatase superfamily)